MNLREIHVILLVPFARKSYGPRHLATLAEVHEPASSPSCSPSDPGDKMSNIASALRAINTHQDLIPMHFVREAGVFVIGGIQKTNGGAIVVDCDGRERGFYHTKREALDALNA